MKIIFVGLHNKPGKRPLDGSTVSGKQIDAVIANFTEMECIKTNLYDVDYMPFTPEEQHELKIDFFNRIDIKPNDIVVLLGRHTWESLKDVLLNPFVHYRHPSPLFSNQGRSEYARVLTNLIAGKISEHFSEKIKM